MKTPILECAHRVTDFPQQKTPPGRRSEPTIGVVNRLLTVAMSLTLWFGAANPAQAQVLNSNGNNLPLPTSGNTFPTFTVGLLPSVVDNGSSNFTGTWTSPAPAAWMGNYTVNGAYPAGTVATGLSTFNFSTLPNGFLPATSYLILNDLDAGSGGEIISVKAYAVGGALITSPWLNSSTVVWASTGSGSGGAVISTDMPGWDWNTVTGSTYTFTGATVTGNPNIILGLSSNVNIGSLEVTRDNTFSHFGLGSPSAIPEPSTYAALMGLGALGFVIWRRRGKPTSIALSAGNAAA